MYIHTQSYMITILSLRTCFLQIQNGLQCRYAVKLRNLNGNSIKSIITKNKNYIHQKQQKSNANPSFILIYTRSNNKYQLNRGVANINNAKPYKHNRNISCTI